LFSTVDIVIEFGSTRHKDQIIITIL